MNTFFHASELREVAISEKKNKRNKKRADSQLLLNTLLLIPFHQLVSRAQFRTLCLQLIRSLVCTSVK